MQASAQPTPRLSGASAIVTGGARGIGRATALALAGHGADVAILDLDATHTESVRETREAISRLGRRCLYFQADVTDSKQLEPAIHEVAREFGKVSILVNNAGKGRDPVSIEEIEERDWDAVVALNLKSAYLCCRTAVKYLKQQEHGKIVNIASTAGRGISPDSIVSYAAAKAGVIGFTRQLARELGRFGITVNAIAPGAIFSGRAAERFTSGSE